MVAGQEGKGSYISHITNVKLRVRDLDCARTAGDVLGLDLNEQKSFKWFGLFLGDTNPNLTAEQRAKFGACDYAFKLKDAKPNDYEIGLVKAPDGDGYDLHVDSWQQQRLLAAVGGVQMNGLRREYAAAVVAAQAKAKLARRGYTVHRENLASGRIRMRLRHR